MFEYFPKIKYPFEGGTFEVTNIFKNVEIILDDERRYTTTPLIIGERPDQVSDRLYNDSKLFWSVLLLNGIKNPLRQWAQSEQSYTEQIEKEYYGQVYQFANVSTFLPAAGSTGFTGDVLKSYEGVDLSSILVGDLIIYETGTGPFSIRCYGAGGVTADTVCGSPNYNQSVVPDTFDTQANIVQVSAGKYFSSCLDSLGRIYAWGKISLPSSFVSRGSLKISQLSGYKYIDACGDRLIAINSNNSLECYGDCTDFTTHYSGQTDIVKTSWTDNKTGGVAIQSNGTVLGFGLSGGYPNTLFDVSCGNGACVGILPSTYGLTAFNVDYGHGIFTSIPSGVTGITMVSVGYNHALALKSDGVVSAWGDNTDGQTDTPTGTYKKLSAGRNYSVGINSDDELVIWGKLIKYGDVSSCAGVTLTSVSPIQLNGEFSLLSSNDHHTILKQSGTNKRYIGVVDLVDATAKRIFVKTYQFPDDKQVLLTDPSTTVVSVWRYDVSTDRYVQIKTIQNQLLSIQKYLDSTKYVKQSGQILDLSDTTNWKDVYLAGYQTAETNSQFITFRKELMDVDLLNKTQIKSLDAADVFKLTAAIDALFSSEATTNEIRLSDL